MHLKQKTKIRLMQQLNRFLFKGHEKQLREELYNKIKPLYPEQVTVRSTIEAQCIRGFDVDKYIPMMQAGGHGFCDECDESTCCTQSDPVALNNEDIKRIKSHGHKGFYKKYSDSKGYKHWGIKKCAPCQFLKDDRCTIYEYRPYVCWRYPLQDTTTGVKLFYIADSCCIAFNLLKHQIIDTLSDQSTTIYGTKINKGV
jgi:Fe-S-cluster containining protein